MKTGFSLLRESATADGVDKDFMRMVVALMTILCEEAIKTAARFSECCGRTVVTGADTLMALKYESHKFWDKDIDERFIARLNEEREHSYESDDSESDVSTDTESEDRKSDDDCRSESAGDDEFHTVMKFNCDDVEFYNDVMRINTEWKSWKPEDPVKYLLKNAIESTEDRLL